MRKKKPNIGDKRVVNRLVIFPLTLNNPFSLSKEKRYLEKCLILQEYKEVASIDVGPMGGVSITPEKVWRDIAWAS